MNSLFHRGIRGYASVLAALSFDDLCVHRVAEKFDLNQQNAMDIIRGLHHHKMIHACGWFKPDGPGGHWREIWRAGAGLDSPRPLGYRGQTVPIRRRPHQFRAELHCFSLLVQALDDGHTAPALVELIGLGRDTVSLVVKHMHALLVIHIAEWERPDYGPILPVYKMGLLKRDAAKPKRITKSEHNRRYWLARAQRIKDQSMIRMMAAPLAQASP